MYVTILSLMRAATAGLEPDRADNATALALPVNPLLITLPPPFTHA